MSIKGIRGAITAQNTSEDIRKSSVELWHALLEENNLKIEQIIHVVISTTADLTKAYPAKFIREAGCNAPLFSCMEPSIENALPLCIRVLLTAETNIDVQHVYLKGAKVLRPDLAQKQEIFNIALDGPSGAGKSTIAKLLASRLGIAYLDTGAMYRATALYMLNHGIDPGDRTAVVKTLDQVSIDIRFCEGVQRVYLNDTDVSAAIREHTVSAAASTVSAIPEVRTRLVAIQRTIAAKQSSVLDGRDIGTAVLPDAKYKFYLTAGIVERAKRRYEELKAKGQSVELSLIARDIEERDRNDMTRAVSPLRQAEDAILIDSSNLDIDGVLIEIMSHIV